MKKTILTIMVAAMMLVAFTACEQQMPSYKNADFISVDQTKAFIAGQPFDASYFTVTLHYTDGSTSQVSPSGVVSADGWDTADYTVTASINTKLTATFEAVVLDPVAVVVSDVENYETDMKTTIEESNPLKTGTFEGATVTFVNGDASYTPTAKVSSDDTIKNNNVTYTLSASITKAQIAVAGEYVLPIKVAASTGTVTCDSTITAVVKDPAADVQESVAIKAFYSVNSAEEVEDLPKLYIGDSVEVNFYVVDANGEKVGGEEASAVTFAEATSGKAAAEKAYVISYKGFDVTAGTPDAIEIAADTDASLTVRYYDEDVVAYKDVTVTVGKGSDCITGITDVSTVSQGLKAGKLEKSSIVVEGTTCANVSEHELGKDDPNFSIAFAENYTVPEVGEDAITVYVTVSYTDKKGDVAKEEFIIADVVATE